MNVLGQEPAFEQPVSQLCTQSQFRSSAYADWCARIGETPRFHRKQWEYCYILQALSVRGMLAPGRCGLGFGVGREPLAAVIAAAGAQVVATDAAPEAVVAAGWADTGQHALALADLNTRGLCAPDAFDERVSFQVMDMNAIDAPPAAFDFVWSSCALEHLGSIERGRTFVMNSLALLKPHGIAVHTTEFNVDHTGPTLESGPTVLFRRQDLEPVFRQAMRAGYTCAVNWTPGDEELDQYIDLPPYGADHHLKLRIEPFTTTSIGLIFERPG